MAALSDIEVRPERRLCKVGDELGYFHCWGQYASVVGPGSAIPHPGGQHSRIFGIVEFTDRVERVNPEKIKFVDEENAFLTKLNEPNKEKE